MSSCFTGANLKTEALPELVETGEDWPEHVGFAVDETFAEVRIGLVNEEDDVLDDVFARLLVSRDPDNKFCHILWKKRLIFSAECDKNCLIKSSANAELFLCPLTDMA